MPIKTDHPNPEVDRYLSILEAIDGIDDIDFFDSMIDGLTEKADVIYKSFTAEEVEFTNRAWSDYVTAKNSVSYDNLTETEEAALESSN